jgi:hypothetical protein
MDWNLANQYRGAGSSGQAGQTNHLSVYKELAKLRTQEAILLGTSNSYTFNNIFILSRVKKVSGNYMSA